jgi:thermitase
MVKLLSINFTGMVSIKTLSFIFLAVFSLSDVVATPGYVQMPRSKFIQQKQAPTIKEKFVEGEVLVKFKSNVTAQVQQYTTTNLGGRSFTSVGKKSRVAKIKLQKGSDVIAAVQAYHTDPNVEHAQPNYIYYASAIPKIPNDPSYDQLWGMKNIGQYISNPSYTPSTGASGFDIDAELAWEIETDCRSAVIAVLDTGINYTHTDLAGNMWVGGSGLPNHGWDFVDNDNDPIPIGVSEAHGTHVAGTIGAKGDNGIGVAGVCWQASIMSVRVLGATGSGSTLGITRGIEFASDHGAKVINMSLSGEDFFDFLFSEAITYARNLDVVVVVAAGNGDPDGLGDNNDGLGGDSLASTIVQPCNFTQDNLLCIAALDQSYSLASFSNYGATSVDVGAPGTNTLSSVAGGQIITSDDFTGWDLTGGWAVPSTSCIIGFHILTNPVDWCDYGSYANDANDRAYKTFDLSGAGAAAISVNFYLWADTKPGDLFYIANTSI